MKRIIYSVASLFLVMVFILGMVSCNTVDKTGVWENATYRKDMEFGKGDKTIVVEVVAGDQSVRFTVHTDEDTVGAALMEHDLIDGEEGQYGLYIKVVNGIVADFDKDQHYWAFYVNDEYAMTGVESTEIDEDATYRLEYSK